MVEGVIPDESNLYVVDPAYLPDNSEARHGEEGEEFDSTTAFAGMANAVAEMEEEEVIRLNREARYSIHSKSVWAHVEPIQMVRQLA